MTTRLHRLWQPGNPQTRVFLPNFWMRLVKPSPAEFLPPNVLKFECSLQMSRHDVTEYLTKIYSLPVRSCMTSVIQGKIETTDRLGKYPVFAHDKEDDFKVAFITLPRGVNFEFPELFPAKRKGPLEMMRDMKTQDEAQKEESKKALFDENNKK